jgi:hypothetical protein
MLVLIGELAAVSSARAQGSGAQTSDLSRAVLALPSTVTPTQRDITDGRLFGGVIQATIRNLQGGERDFVGVDQISFLIRPRIPAANLPTGEGFTFPFVGTKDLFEKWAQDHAGDLLKLLFPASLSLGLSGRDAAQFYSQQFLLTTALSTDSIRQSGSRGRLGAGGLFEFERFGREVTQENDSAWALQGLYAFGRTVSVQARLAQQHESLTTRSTGLAVDYHPFIEINRTARWRVGATARGGFQYASSHGTDPTQRDALSLGSVDVGGGGWVSVRKDFRRARIGGGGLFQGIKSHVPPGDGDTFRSRFARALNRRGPDYDVTYGATFGFDTSVQTAVILKYVDTHSVQSEATDRSGSRFVLAGLAYALAPGSTLTGGYRISTGSGMRAHSVFFQGNFGW